MRRGKDLFTTNPRKANVKVRPSPSDYPRSYTANYMRPAAVTAEKDLIGTLKVDTLLRQPYLC